MYVTFIKKMLVVLKMKDKIFVALNFNVYFRPLSIEWNKQESLGFNASVNGRSGLEVIAKYFT